MTKRLTQEEYILAATKVHNGFYTYNDLVYISGKHKVEITCPLHGNFWQLAETHKDSKRGCPVCARENTTNKQKKSKEDFVKDAKTVHGNRYDYSLFDYVNSKTHGKIVCPVHNVFEQTPANHLNGHGCRECGNIANTIKQRDTVEQFIEKAIKVHGDKYSYRKVEYKNNRTKVLIDCNSCQKEFKQSPDNHLQGAGCPKCGKSGYNRNKPGTFYILKDADVTKVGITNVSINKRLKQINHYSKREFIILHTQYFENGEHTLNLETEVLRYLRSKYKNPEISFSGSTECFYDVDLQDILNFVTPLTKESEQSDQI